MTQAVHQHVTVLASGITPRGGLQRKHCNRVEQVFERLFLAVEHLVRETVDTGRTGRL
jgi:hypothetical protein